MDATGGLASLPGRLLAGEYQRGYGAVMTPSAAATEMVRLVPDDLIDGAVFDPACGHGELLVAAHHRWPHRRLVGCELHPGLALVAALRLLELRGIDTDDRQVEIYVGDGLVRQGLRPALVIGNPPYVGEKGNRELFAKVKALHEGLQGVFAPRMDLLYLFLARGMEFVLEGGWCLWLTPPHWLYADGARNLRAILQEKGSPRLFVRLEEPALFSALPGQNHLICGIQRGGATDESPGLRAWVGRLQELQKIALEDMPGADGDGIQEESWRPFLEERDFELRMRLQEHGVKLQALLEDHQGFVSGADKVTRRHQKIAGCEHLRSGDPIFVADAMAMPQAWRGLPEGLCRPLLRARHLQKNLIVMEPPKDAFCLYVDQVMAKEYGEILGEHLAPFRPILERRREVRQGSMPWVRLHWPRERAKMLGPKLVVARRASEMCFSLDLSGSPVSSDCTFLTAPEGIKGPVEYLVRLMVLLNDEWTEEYFLRFGKRKGALMEFYSTPLKNLLLAVSDCQEQVNYESTILGTSRVEQLEAQVEVLLEQIALG